MTDLEQLLPIWRELETEGSDYVLATVVAVDGPSYRKPGARMLIASDGRRAGTISGGCLEAEVARRAWWHTESGPTIQSYSTAQDDGEMPYGSGCGGVVYILLERRGTASALLNALESAFRARLPIAIATVLDGPLMGQHAFAGDTVEAENREPAALRSLADRAWQRKQSFSERVQLDGVDTHVWVDYRRARPGLWIFGAGDDAKPLVSFARTLGWFVGVADGRSHLATADRFRAADTVNALTISDPNLLSGLDIRPTDAAVVMTHSFEQDAKILAALLSVGEKPWLAYLGVLGPQRRTREVLIEAARMQQHQRMEEVAEHWLGQLHAPTGLDLGAETSAAIALSILAEVQKTLQKATGEPLAKVRASSQALSR